MAILIKCSSILLHERTGEPIVYVFEFFSSLNDLANNGD